MIHLAQELLLLIGAVTAVGLIAVLLFSLAIAVLDDIKSVVRYTIQSRKDTKLFHQVEEFRRDFRS